MNKVKFGIINKKIVAGTLTFTILTTALVGCTNKLGCETGTVNKYRTAKFLNLNNKETDDSSDKKKNKPLTVDLYCIIEETKEEKMNREQRRKRKRLTR